MMGGKTQTFVVPLLRRPSIIHPFPFSLFSRRKRKKRSLVFFPRRWGKKGGDGGSREKKYAGGWHRSVYFCLSPPTRFYRYVCRLFSRSPFLFFSLAFSPFDAREFSFFVSLEKWEKMGEEQSSEKSGYIFSLDLHKVKFYDNRRKRRRGKNFHLGKGRRLVNW